jgi:hypothetical protein
VLFYPSDPGWSNGRIRIRDKTSRIRNTALRNTMVCVTLFSGGLRISPQELMIFFSFGTNAVLCRRIKLLLVQVTPKEQYMGQLIHMECRAWFDGVVHDTKDKLGLVQFELHFLPRN